MVSERLEQVRDVFIFSCFSGLAYVDVANLKEDNIRKSFDGNLWIITKRQKTNTDVNVPLLDIPKMILEKYKGKLPNGKVLPIISNQKLNAYLKEIADVIMNCVEYPEGLFRVQELLTGCQILLQSNDISMITRTIHFLSMAIYSSTNLSEYFSDLFPLIFKISFPNSDIFIKVYFSLLTNIFTDLKSNNNIA